MSSLTGLFVGRGEKGGSMQGSESRGGGSKAVNREGMLEKFAVKVIGIQRCEVCILGQGSCINVQCKLAVKLMCDKVQPAVNTLQGSQCN